MNKVNTLFETAKILTAIGLRVIPLGETLKPTMNWADYREHPLTEAEIEEWFKPDNKGRTKANGIAYALRGKGISCLSMDVDGKDAKEVFFDEFLPNLSKEVQQGFKNTTRTKTKSDGLHFLLEIDLSGKPYNFPAEIKQKGEWSSITIEGPAGQATKHSQINMLGTENMSREYGPGYTSIIDIESRVQFGILTIHEILDRLKLFKTETGIIRIAGNTLKPFWKSPDRDEIVFATSGFLGKKGGVPQELTIRLFNHIMRVTALSDEDKKHTIQVIKDTYKRIKKGGIVSGFDRFLEAVKKNNDIVNEIQSCFKQLGYFPEYHNGNGPLNGHAASATTGIDDPEIMSLPTEIQTKLSSNVFSLMARNPLRFYVADESRKEIMKVVIARPKDVSETTESNNTITTTTTKTKTIRYTEKDTIIDAIPAKVIINDNPLDGTKTYQVTFQHKGSRPFTVGPATIANLLEGLETKGRLVAARDAKQALTAILVKYEDSQKAEITSKPPQYGYFWIDNKIVGYDTTQENIDLNLDADRTKILQCIDVLEALYQKNKHRSAYVTVVKWSTLAPFSYARKFINEIHNDWIPDLQAYGESQTGKNTLSMYALAIWRLHTTKHLQAHRIGFAQADTKAKHGRVVSQTTYLVTIHETGELSEPKYYDIVEQQKNKVEFAHVRGKHKNISQYEREPAMASLILTGNPSPPSEVAYRIRVLPLAFDLKHCTTDQEKLEFDDWFYKQKNIDRLSILGDFAAKYIIEHPTEVLKDLHWEDASKLILCKFYESVGKNPPQWIDLLEKPNLVEDNKDQTRARLKALFEREILEGYRRDSRDAAEYNFATKLERCLGLRSVSCLTKHMSKQGKAEIAITYSIMDLLPKYKIYNIGALAALASHMPGFKAERIKLGGRTTWTCNGSYDDFRRFLECHDEMITNNAEGGEDQDE